MGRSECSHYVGVGAQGAGVAAFVTTVLGYTLIHKMLSGSPWCRSSPSGGRSLRCMDGTSPAAIAAPGSASALPPPHVPPYKVGLLDLTVPSKRGGAYTNLLLANDISIEKAVQSVSDTLYIYLREDPASASATPPPPSSASPTAPELRVYLSELYGQLWDVCYLHRNLPLDVRILYNNTDTSAAATATPAPQGKKGGAGAQGKSSLSLAQPQPGNIPTSWEEALLKPELQVVFSRKDAATELSNAKREALGLPPAKLEWLDDAVRVALETTFYYLEDEQSHIPHFPRVAVGGTFDRLHNGHKKLLTLAASVCQSRLTIGITSTEMLAAKKNADQIEALEDRVEAVRSFLHSVFPNLALDLVVLKDPFGPPAHEADFDAIVVSSETIAGAAKINDLRTKQGMKPLVVVVTRRTVSSLLSSTFIRNNLPPRKRTLPPR